MSPIVNIVAGVDIGNSTTEVCIARYDQCGLKFLSSSLCPTTGTKGTIENVAGIVSALNQALKKINKSIHDLTEIRINEAAPVIGDTAMETITETIITESTMIGHNPDTPAGVGLATGYIVDLLDLAPNDVLRTNSKDKDYLVLVPESIDYLEAAKRINELQNEGFHITGAILQSDEAVLVYNRLQREIPIVDEVRHIHKIPKNVFGAIEVALEHDRIQTLSNPYGIATIFHLEPKETKYIIPIAKSLIGTRSAVVIKTDKGSVKEKIIPAGHLCMITDTSHVMVDVDLGAVEIMNQYEDLQPVKDIKGQLGTNVGKMLDGIKKNMSELTGEKESDINIKDILAVDTIQPITVKGALAGEVSMEKAVGIAAMVKTKNLPMQTIAHELKKITGVDVKIAGVEAVMASLGAYTTPGTMLPLAVLDLGGGSTDGAILYEDGLVLSQHLAGAGQLVTLLINSELGLEDPYLAEKIKRYPVAKVESLFHIRMENGFVKFFEEPLPSNVFGKVVILEDNNMVPVPNHLTIDKIIHVRREAKRKVFIKNSLRVLTRLDKMNKIPNVVLVGGSALDFEIPQLIMDELSKYGIVAGRGNIRRELGPRNAVATGLVMSCI